VSARIVITGRERLPLRHRATPLLAVGVARLLAHCPPRRIRAVLGLLRIGAAPANYDQAKAAHHAVRSVSILCAGESCLQRSLAIVLLCRIRGVWPTWCTGIRVAPFCAHAWVEVDSQPVGEPYPAGYFRPIVTVPPRSNKAGMPSGASPKHPGGVALGVRHRGMSGVKNAWMMMSRQTKTETATRSSNQE
jgi:hypothetical protein